MICYKKSQFFSQKLFKGENLIAQDKQNLQRNIVNIFYPSGFTSVLDTQKNCLNETVLLSTHNICFG